jgi:cytosine/adenosine deaminase-related metal-dependent hydrolase
MLRYRATWVVPIGGPPIRDGWVEIDGDRVVAVGKGRSSSSVEERDLGCVAVMPGLVNAHTHLELCYQRAEIPAADEFVTWIRGVITSRRRQSDPQSPVIADCLRRGIEEAILTGTAVVGDISNTLVTVEPLAQSPLAAVVFHELLGFNAADPDDVVERALARVFAVTGSERVRPSLAAHAPYSVSPGLFGAILRGLDRLDGVPWSVHVSESAAEVEFLESASGPWRVLLEELGSWNPSWTAPRMSPVEYLDVAGMIDARMLAVHGVQMTGADLARLAARHACLVTCPRSNAYTGAGTPPLPEFYRSGVRVAVGTDSLASAPDLNVFSELAVMRGLAPSTPASLLLDSATLQGARALGFAADYGSIEPGKRARLIAVSVPKSTVDVEEYLVTGIQPEQVSWVELSPCTDV